ncbi:uncharacterized protein LOC141903285 [Tubulanus polymorphus]|uniref:uncharacterized protein LOC141903285 n=1 Tax=Tubulanus polymorphus TaxID=672921 RepID=UPI003DA56663
MTRKGRPLGSSRKTFVVDSSSSEDNDSDDEYIPSESDSGSDNNYDSDEENIIFDEMRDDSRLDYGKQAKVIVLEHKLFELFRHCNSCVGYNKIEKRTKGTLLVVQTTCQLCWKQSSWQNQDFIAGKPVLNILISAMILLTGNWPTKSIRLFKLLNIAIHSTRSFFRYQQNFFHGAINWVWEVSRKTILDGLNGERLLGGDGRCDSMGHSAKFWSYSIMDIKAKKVVSLQLVQSNEVKNSNAMELEGLKRCTTELGNIPVKAFISDMHLQIGKWIRTVWKVSHYYDCWHVVKSITKKLEKLAKTKAFVDIQDWVKSLKYHLYWCVSSSPKDDKESIKKKWLSAVEHVQGVHVNCTPAGDKIEEVLKGTRLVNKVTKMSPYGQTSQLECLHSVFNHFAPKMLQFSYRGLLSRLHIAALHFNENSSRMQKLKKDGTGRVSLIYPKYKKRHVLRFLLNDATYDYVNDCLNEIIGDIKKKQHTKKKYC